MTKFQVPRPGDKRILIEQSHSGIISVECQTCAIGEEHGSGDSNNRSSDRQLRRKGTEGNEKTITEN